MCQGPGSDAGVLECSVSLASQKIGGAWPSKVRPDIMRSLAALLTAFVLAACTRDQSRPQNASMTPAVAFLLTSAATDFHTHTGPLPVRFRNVRGGYVMTPDGVRQYRLCGEFLPAQDGGQAEWTPFVTIKTSGYEQLLGRPAVTFCDRSSMTAWDTGICRRRCKAALIPCGSSRTTFLIAIR